MAQPWTGPSLATLAGRLKAVADVRALAEQADTPTEVKQAELLLKALRLAIELADAEQERLIRVREIRAAEALRETREVEDSVVPPPAAVDFAH